MIWITSHFYEVPGTGRRDAIDGLPEVMEFIKANHANKLREYAASRNRGFSPAIAQGVFGEMVAMDSRSCEGWMHALEAATMDAREAITDSMKLHPGVGIRSNGEWVWNKELAEQMLNEVIANESLREKQGETSVQREARRELRVIGSAIN